MYTKCMFCTKPLGTNEVVETFPVGRRLAFDEARGRLWVVCRKCERWNLTPLEERWEAVEACERIFRDTRIRPADDDPGFKVQVCRTSHSVVRKKWYHGEEAHRFASAIVPGLNAMGGTKAAVRDAAGEIEAAGHPERFLSGIAGGDGFENGWGEPGYMAEMPKPTRLALEMALHEEQERRALEGELWLLERAWREAEEIAEISDNLFLPEGTEEFIREHGGATEGDGTPRRGQT